MRWYWIDKFTVFQSGSHATAVKNVSLSEDYLVDRFSGFPVMPGSLVIEGFAQTAGLLVGECSLFQERVVLAKISKCIFHRYPVPGDTLTYSVKIDDIKPDGAFVTGSSHIDGELQAEIELMFAHLSDADTNRELFEPVDFLAMLRIFGLYDVGRKSDGSPLDQPPHLLEAELAARGIKPS